jgi:hypothetical protein
MFDAAFRATIVAAAPKPAYKAVQSSFRSMARSCPPLTRAETFE